MWVDTWVSRKPDCTARLPFLSLCTAVADVPARQTGRRAYGQGRSHLPLLSVSQS